MIDFIIQEFGADIITLVLRVLLAVLVWCAYLVGRKLITTEQKRYYAAVAVKAVEQIYKELHGDEKLAMALEHMDRQLTKYSIPFDAEEAHLLIHAALAELNGAFQKIPEDDTTPAVSGFADE